MPDVGCSMLKAHKGKGPSLSPVESLSVVGSPLNLGLSQFVLSCKKCESKMASTPIVRVKAAFNEGPNVILT